MRNETEPLPAEVAGVAELLADDMLAELEKIVDDMIRWAEKLKRYSGTILADLPPASQERIAEAWRVQKARMDDFGKEPT